MTPYKWMFNPNKDFHGPYVDKEIIPFFVFVYYEIVFFTSGEEPCSGHWIREKGSDCHTLFDKELSSWN